MRKRKLIKLCESWLFQARKRFEAAELEETELGRRALEHGAMIYFNAAEDLMNIIQPKFGFSLLLEKFKQDFKRK